MRRCLGLDGDDHKEATSEDAFAREARAVDGREEVDGKEEEANAKKARKNHVGSSRQNLSPNRRGSRRGRLRRKRRREGIRGMRLDRYSHSHSHSR